MEPQLFHCGFWHIHESNCDSTGVTLELQWVMWGLQYQICEFLEGSEVRLYLTAFICTSPEKGNAMGFACLFACFFILGFESAFGFHGFFGTCECSWNNLIFLQSFFRAGVIIRLKWRFWPSHWQGPGRTFSLFAILGDIHFPGSFRVLGRSWTENHQWWRSVKYLWKVCERQLRKANVSADLLYRGHTSAARCWKCLLETSSCYVPSCWEGPSCWHSLFHIFFPYF